MTSKQTATTTQLCKPYKTSGILLLVITALGILTEKQLRNEEQPTCYVTEVYAKITEMLYQSQQSRCLSAAP